MSMTQSRNSFYKKVPYYGVFLALALILSYIENLIPFFFGIPGMKLGLTNVIVLICMYLFSPKDALIISIFRIIISAILFGNPFSLAYSLAGGILSFLIMLLLYKKTSSGILLISVMGGISHNLGQVLIAMLIVENYKLFYYFFALMISGIITGALIGLISSLLIPRLRTIINN